MAFSCLAAQIATSSHLVSEQHVRCQEHGELEDMASVAHVGEVAHDQASFENGAAPDSRPGHDHCVFGTHARQSQATDEAPAQEVGATAVAAATPVPRPILSAPLFVIYRLAPKTSPPA